jgi:hypothetical protein
MEVTTEDPTTASGPDSSPNPLFREKNRACSPDEPWAPIDRVGDYPDAAVHRVGAAEAGTGQTTRSRVT